MASFLFTECRAGIYNYLQGLVLWPERVRSVFFSCLALIFSYLQNHTRVTRFFPGPHPRMIPWPADTILAALGNLPPLDMAKYNPWVGI